MLERQTMVGLPFSTQNFVHRSYLMRLVFVVNCSAPFDNSKQTEALVTHRSFVHVASKMERV